MEEVIKKLKKLKARRIFIQFPEGIKLKIQDITKKLEEVGFETVVCLEKTFGACDIRDTEAKRFGCDAILHIGHTDFGVKSDIPVIYWEYFLDVDVLQTLEKEFGKLQEYKKIGLVANVQFVKNIQKVREFLEKKGKKVFVYKSLQYPGEILGCRLGAAKKIEGKVDCFLCISAAKFYSLGLALQTNKRVFNLDLEKREIYDVEELKKKILKIKEWNKAKLEDARRVGILLSWKRGQIFKGFLAIKRRLEKKGKEVYVFAMDEITPEKIEGLKLDILISCACPRIGIDDLEKYKIPILSVEDLY